MTIMDGKQGYQKSDARGFRYYRNIEDSGCVVRGWSAAGCSRFEVLGVPKELEILTEKSVLKS